ncbi:YeiH family protein [Paenibacillus wynnii]|uniref:YeiH family protein n=1 Tax=Paenibacillus wynnii TaxID=268407 RepID=UPI00278CC09D|nr:YeiH family protein [Paenibacillus wynnii]MDQ0194390.1 putative integral membrane protein (TIGR00698 family) [Paenibacillus wynnii]
MEHTLMAKTKAHQRINVGFIQGLILTFVLSVTAKGLAALPFLSIMGQLMLAILLGILLRAIVGVPHQAVSGITFSSKRLLRVGIILLGMKLNLGDILHAGPKVGAIAVINIVFTLFTVYGLTRWLKVDRKLGLLTACGTAICGAAAVVAISPQIKASDNEIAVSAATVAILGTIFTLLYTILYSILGLSPTGYGILSGATLHEVAHVIAAAAPGGQEAVDIAVIVKLTRVAMLVPVAMIIAVWEGRKERKIEDKPKGIQWRKLPVPWFILGFLMMSGFNTLGILPGKITEVILVVAYLLIAMAMAGLGLGVDIATFRRLGKKPFLAGLIGSVLLSALGFLLVHAFGLA